MKTTKGIIRYISPLIVIMVLAGVTGCGETPTSVPAAYSTAQVVAATVGGSDEFANVTAGSSGTFYTVTPATGPEFLVSTSPASTVTSLSPTPTLLRGSDYPPTATLPPATPTALPSVNSNAEVKTAVPTATIKPTGPLPATLKGTLAATINAFPKAVANLAWSPDGKTLAATSRETNTIGLWDSRGQSLGVLNATSSPASGPPPYYKTLAWSPDGKTLAASLNDTAVQRWDFSGANAPKLLSPLIGHTQPVTGLAWSPDGKNLASGSADGTIRLWGKDGKLSAVLTGHSGIIFRLAWSPDGKTLASVGGERPNMPQRQQDSTIRLWSVEGKPLAVLDGGQDNWFIDLAWSPDGQILAASDFVFSKIYYWNRVGEPLTSFWAAQEETGQIAWSPDSQTLASCGGDEQTRLWNRLGQHTGSLSEPGKNVCDVAWSPDGKVIASALFGPSDSVNLWAADGRKIVSLGPASAAETSTYLVWSPDGQSLAAGYNDGTIRLWK